MPGSNAGNLFLREYKGIRQIVGPLIFIEGIHNVGYNELVEINDASGKKRLGIVLETGEGYAVVQVFEGTSELTLPDTTVRFQGSPLTIPVTEEMLGRVFDGLGRPIDGAPEPVAEEYYVNIDGSFRFHRPLCFTLKKTNPEKLRRIKTRKQALLQGFSPCRNCRP